MATNPLEQAIVESFQGLGYKVTRGEKVKGRSGIEHVPDLKAERADFPTNRIILVKVKATESSEPLRVDEVMQFWSMIFDTGFEGVIVTNCKPTQNARTFADFYKISITELSGISLRAAGTFFKWYPMA